MELAGECSKSARSSRNAGRIGCGRTLSWRSKAKGSQPEGAIHRLRQNDQFNLLYGARRFVRRLNEFGIVHRYEEFADNELRPSRWAALSAAAPPIVLSRERRRSARCWNPRAYCPWLPAWL